MKASFDDAIKAREDKVRQENQAEAYANEVVPKARGAAARRIEDAKAYRDKVIAEANGEANRFTAVLREYEKAPEVTRERLYLDTVEDVLSNTSKVMMDADSGNSLMYLPLDKLIQPKGSSMSPSTNFSTLSDRVQERVEKPATREVNRGRRVR